MFAGAADMGANYAVRIAEAILEFFYDEIVVVLGVAVPSGAIGRGTYQQRDECSNFSFTETSGLEWINVLN